jgi:hypothetical protein
MPGATLIALSDRHKPADRHKPSTSPDPSPTYTCPECGHALRVSGWDVTACTSSPPTSGQTTL